MTPLHVRQRRERRYSRLIALGYTSYENYLNSTHWAALKARYRASDLEQSCMCGETEHLQLHHKTYERVGEELLEDLVPLCARCHAMIHALEARGDIGLDFAGFESVERALRYAAERPTPEYPKTDVELRDGVPLWYRVMMLERNPDLHVSRWASLRGRVESLENGVRIKQGKPRLRHRPER